MQEASDPDRGNFRTSESDFSTVPCVVLAVADIAYYAQIMRVIFKTLRWILHVITYSIKLFMPLLPILRYPDPRLKKAILEKDWHKIAYYYNGAGYAVQAFKLGIEPYNFQMKKAYEKYRGA